MACVASVAMPKTNLKWAVKINCIFLRSVFIMSPSDYNFSVGTRGPAGRRWRGDGERQSSTDERTLSLSGNEVAQGVIRSQRLMGREKEHGLLSEIPISPFVSVFILSLINRKLNSFHL